MSDKLIKIAKMFRLALCEWYNGSLQRNAPAEGLSWLKSAFVFSSLEACRHMVCDPARKEEVLRPHREARRFFERRLLGAR